MRQISLLSIVCLLLLCSCEKTEILEPKPQSDAPISRASISGSFRNLAVGDSIVLDAGFDADGTVDSSAIHYRWKFTEADSQVVAIAEGEIAKWIPPQAGNYHVTLEITYQGKTQSTQVVFVVVEKPVIVWVDGQLQERLKTLKAKMPGSYAGIMSSPWIPDCSVSVVFREDGTYSAWNATTADHPALYYGTDEEGIEKTWQLTDVRADGSGTGTFYIRFDAGNAVREVMNAVQFDSSFEHLSWEFMHFEKYGPVQLQLKRTHFDSLPPRPLPTPQFREYSVPMEGWTGEARLSIEPIEGLRAYYQVVPEASDIGVMNASVKWDAKEMQPVEGEIVIQDPGHNLYLLIRSTDGQRWSGVKAMQLWFKR